MPAYEIPAAIQDRHAASTAAAGTTEPNPLPPEMASSELQAHRVFVTLPFSSALAGPIVQNHTVSFRPNLDGSHFLSVAGPLPHPMAFKCPSSRPYAHNLEVALPRQSKEPATMPPSEAAAVEQAGRNELSGWRR